MKNGIFMAAATSLILMSSSMAQETVCVPQFVDGVMHQYRWKTTLVLQNAEPTRERIQLHFHSTDGSPMDGVWLRERLGHGPQAAVGPGGQFETPALAGNAVRSYQSLGQGTAQAGYVCADSPDRVRLHAMIHLYDADGNLISDTGIIPGRALRRGSFLADQTEGATGGIAFLNPSFESPTTCAVELFEENGETPIGNATVTLQPRAQIARLLLDMFPELLTGDVGFVRVTCDNPVCLLVLRLRGLEMLQIPVFVESEP